MSTRCNIIIKDRWNRRVYLYHHCDGYPEGVGADLKEYLSKWADWQIRQHGLCDIPNKLVKDNAGLNDKSYEITAGLHGDIDYCYVINCKAGTLRCYRCNDYSDTTFSLDWGKVFRRCNLRDIPSYEELKNA